jgi:hypothetical protein
MRQRVQVVIVVLIAGLTVSLLVVFVHHVREEAARTQCQNNLKQIVLACHGYHDSHQKFPPATIPNPILACPPEKRMSWVVNLDPYLWARMDERWKFQRDRAWDDPAHAHMVDEAHPIFLCPATTHEGSMNVTNYIGIAGLGRDAPTYSLNDARSGFFGYDRVVSVKDIRGGESNVIAVAETLKDLGPWAAGGPSTCRGLDDTPPYLGTGGQFSSGHRLINLAIVDGSVRSVGSNIDPKVLEALAMLTGGDIEKLGDQ